MRIHERSNHREEVCDHCGHKFGNEYELRKHRVLVHKFKEGFLCKNCPQKVFNSELTLQRHIHDKHGWGIDSESD